MKPVRALMMATAVGLTLSACTAPETATRNAPMEDVMSVAMPAMSQTYAPQEVRISVPDTLMVSEANRFYPGGDIVWRGDAPGDRHAQVQAIFEAAAAKGLASVEGATPVLVDVEVTRFHALTEKTRYTVGGVHSLKFTITLRDPDTGEILRDPQAVNADLQGYGGKMAIAAEAKGLGQKMRITMHLAKVLRDELSLETGFVPPKGGITARITPI